MPLYSLGTYIGKKISSRYMIDRKAVDFIRMRKYVKLQETTSNKNTFIYKEKTNC